jgi:hypothetical protein
MARAGFLGDHRLRINGTAVPRKALRAVTMEGVDIYDPVTNTIDANRADNVAAWFVDSDYDGRTFCMPRISSPHGIQTRAMIRAAFQPIARAYRQAAALAQGVFSGVSAPSPPF